MKSRTLNTLLSSIFILCLMLTIVFGVILFVTENNLYLILICVSLVLAIGIPNILIKYIKVDILKELEENDNRNCVFRRIQATHLGDCRPPISAIVGH